MKYPWAAPGVQVECINDAWYRVNGKKLSAFRRWLNAPWPQQGKVYTITRVAPGFGGEIYLGLRGFRPRHTFCAYSFRPLQHNADQVEAMRRLVLKRPQHVALRELDRLNRVTHPADHRAAPHAE
jgi:hypothetical protein